MPQHQRTGVCGKVGFVRREHGPQEPQVLELTELGKRWCSGVIDRERERGLIVEQAEKDQVIVIDVLARLLAGQEYHVQWIAADETLVAPDRNEAATLAARCTRQPIGVLPALAAAIDEGSCEHVVVLHRAPCAENIDVRRSLPKFHGANSIAAETFDPRPSPTLRLDFARRADSEIQRVGIVHITSLAMSAEREYQLVVAGDRVQQVPGPLETQQRAFVHEQVSLESAANAMPEFDVWSWPAGMYVAALVDAQEEADAKQGNERRSLQLMVRVLDEAPNLPR